LKEEDFEKAGEIYERMGYCFFRAALQAKTSRHFKGRMKLAVKSYERTVELFRKVAEDVNEAKISHSKALVNFANLWIEKAFSKRSLLLDEWWTLERETLRAHEKNGDFLAIGKVCNDMMQGCHDQRIWYAKDWFEFANIAEECFYLGDKAIEALSKVEDVYELARAYCWASWYYGFFALFGGYQNIRDEFPKKSLEYSRKAVTLSEKTGDDHLIGWSYNSASLAALVFEGNHKLALQFNEETRKHSLLTKDNALIGVGIGWAGSICSLVQVEEDPDKQKETLIKADEWAQNSIRHYEMASWHILTPISYRIRAGMLVGLASIEISPEVKRALLEKAITSGRVLLKHIRGRKGLMDHYVFDGLSHALCDLAKTETEIISKRLILKEALGFRKKAIMDLKRVLPTFYPTLSSNYNLLALIQIELSKIALHPKRELDLVNDAVSSMEISIKFIERVSKEHYAGWKSGLFGEFFYLFGKILSYQFAQTKDRKILKRAIGAFIRSVEIFGNTGLTSHAAESYWQIGKLLDLLGENLEAAHNYDLAAKTYDLAAKKIPQLKDFYKTHSFYMQAWSQIEQARYNHSIEEYEKAMQNYQNSAKLHGSTDHWSYLASNYVAWAYMEEAEGLSRKEKTQPAKQKFQKAFEQFCNAEESFKLKLEEITSADEKDMLQKLFKASDLRRKYCQARIFLEEAKLMDRKGKFLQSSKKYGEAAQNISAIVGKLDVEAERKELEYVLILCRAWEKMAEAEATTSSESYLEAAKLFEQAKEHCYTKKASLWTLGNSSFCKGLAAKNKFQSTFDKSYHSMANKHVEQAADYYRRAGFQVASEYAKATQRLLDGYVYMNSAQEEIDPEKKTKYYQMAEQLLQIAAGLFTKAMQPEKTSEIQRILVAVREEKALAASLNEVMHAPVITSSTMSFSAPSPTSEVPVGLESFEHANVQANIVAGVKEIKVGESFCLTVEFVNAGKEPALLTRVEDFIPPDFVVVKKPEIYRLEDNCLNMKGKQLGPLNLVEAKLVLQPSRKGVYQLKPRVHYLDELGQNKSLQLESLEIKVAEVILEDRMATGTKELDSLLLGGIPEGYAVVLTGPPSDERSLLIKNFLEAGTKKAQITFYITSEAAGLESLLEKRGFYLFLCNPESRTKLPDLPNISRLRSKTDLTNLNIALAKAHRSLTQNFVGSKRVCVEIVSDVLLDYGAKTTRKWLSELITDLGSKGFTMLAVMNPSMHPPDQATAVLDLFDGEISVYQTDDPLECKKSLRVKKLRNQDYIKNPICLTKPTT